MECFSACHILAGTSGTLNLPPAAAAAQVGAFEGILKGTSKGTLKGTSKGTLKGTSKGTLKGTFGGGSRVEVAGAQNLSLRLLAGSVFFRVKNPITYKP